LPPHITVIPAETAVSTFSLFQVMDYCLTVRGTIGMEAASLGIPVLTAGTGRYDHKGFTIDVESREAYRERLARIEEIPPLSAEARELAERFAYGVWMLRALPLVSFTCEYQRDRRASCQVRINAVTAEDWRQAPDLAALASWFAASKDEDFLMPDELAVRHPARQEGEVTAAVSP
jgi:hypothetical protein